MIHAIIGSILSCMLVYASIASFFTSDNRKDLMLADHEPSIYFQIDEKNGSFIPISELLKNRNKLLCTIMKEASHVRH